MFTLNQTPYQNSTNTKPYLVYLEQDSMLIQYTSNWTSILVYNIPVTGLPYYPCIRGTVLQLPLHYRRNLSLIISKNAYCVEGHLTSTLALKKKSILTYLLDSLMCGRFSYDYLCIIEETYLYLSSVFSNIAYCGEGNLMSTLALQKKPIFTYL